MVFQRLVKVNWGKPSWFGGDLDKDVRGIWGVIEEAAGRDGRGIRERGGEGEDNSERRNFVRFVLLIPKSAGGGRRHRDREGWGLETIVGSSWLAVGMRDGDRDFGPPEMMDYGGVGRGSF